MNKYIRLSDIFAASAGGPAPLINSLVIRELFLSNHIASYDLLNIRFTDTYYEVIGYQYSDGICEKRFQIATGSRMSPDTAAKLWASHGEPPQHIRAVDYDAERFTPRTGDSYHLSNEHPSLREFMILECSPYGIRLTANNVTILHMPIFTTTPTKIVGQIPPGARSGMLHAEWLSRAEQNMLSFPVGKSIVELDIDANNHRIIDFK